MFLFAPLLDRLLPGLFKDGHSILEREIPRLHLLTESLPKRIQPLEFSIMGVLRGFLFPLSPRSRVLTDLSST